LNNANRTIHITRKDFFFLISKFILIHYLVITLRGYDNLQDMQNILT